MLGARGVVADTVGNRSFGHTAEPRRGTIGAELSSSLVIIALAASFLVYAFLQPFSSHAPALRAAVETMVILCALAGSALLRVQFSQRRRLRDLLLMGTLLGVGIQDLCAYVLPAALHTSSGAQLSVLLWGKLLVAAGFAAAAGVPPERTVSRDRWLAVCGAALLLTCVAGAELLGFLPGAHSISSATATVPGPVPSPIAFVLVLAAAGLFVYAAVRFARQRSTPRSGLASPIASGLIMLAAARVCGLALPLVGPERISAREFLCLFAYVLIFIAIVRQEFQLRRELTSVGAIAERRRVAQDLHDGLAQDLAFIAAHGARMAEISGEEHPVAVAARRALAISRGTISELSAPEARTPLDSLEAIAHELRSRFEVVIDVEAPSGELAPDALEDVERITREAIANAARHGNARNVTVSLRLTGDGTLLRVRDDGSGIGDGGGAAGEGFGLRSIRERAAAHSGYVRVRQPPRGGTELEVLLA